MNKFTVFGILLIIATISIISIGTVVIYETHLPNIAIIPLQMIVGLIGALMMLIAYSMIFNKKVVFTK